MSTISKKLTASKNGLTALLEYANQTTGQSDTDIGEAIRTLCDGYGQGGGGGIAEPYSILKPGGVVELYGLTEFIKDLIPNYATTITGMENIKILPVSAFNSYRSMKSIPNMPNLEEINYYCFLNNAGLTGRIVLPPRLRVVGFQAFMGCTGITEVVFQSKPNLGNAIFSNCTNLTDIYVPWAEGEVANENFGATNATIHYNYVPEEE